MPIGPHRVMLSYHYEHVKYIHTCRIYLYVQTNEGCPNIAFHSYNLALPVLYLRESWLCVAIDAAAEAKLLAKFGYASFGMSKDRITETFIDPFEVQSKPAVVKFTLRARSYNTMYISIIFNNHTTTYREKFFLGIFYM